MPPQRDNPPRDVDELYGLEPVIEPGDAQDAAGHPGSLLPWTVECPYCGETFETMLDLSAGPTSYIEDCQICCRPIEFELEVADDGAGAATLVSIQLGRSD